MSLCPKYLLVTESSHEERGDLADGGEGGRRCVRSTVQCAIDKMIRLKKLNFHRHHGWARGLNWPGILFVEDSNGYDLHDYSYLLLLAPYRT